MAQQTILGRVSQMVRANVNDLLDRAEDPEKMLDQLVRDYTNAISDAKSEVATTVGNLRLTEQDLRETRESAEAWGRKAAAASRKADEAETSDTADQFNSLATTALTKQIGLEKQATALQAKVDADTITVNGLKEGLTKMEVKLGELKDKRQELISRAKMAQAQVNVQQAVASVNAADPTSELARFEERIRRQEAQAKGLAEVQSNSLDDQFASLEDDEVAVEAEARLAALKGKTPVGAA